MYIYIYVYVYFFFKLSDKRKQASKLLQNHMLDVSGNLSSPTLHNMRTSKASIAKHDTGIINIGMIECVSECQELQFAKAGADTTQPLLNKD